MIGVELKFSVTLQTHVCCTILQQNMGLFYKIE